MKSKLWNGEGADSIIAEIKIPAGAGRLVHEMWMDKRAMDLRKRLL